MKSTFLLKKIGFTCLMFIAVFTLCSSGGGKGGGKSGKNPGGGTPKTCGKRYATLVLHQGNMNPMNIPGRQSNYGAPQPNQNIINGGQATSPNSLYTDVNTKSYCFITITASGCSDYGNGGTKTFTWDSSNDGNSYDSSMQIEIPNTGQFHVAIDYHENCGPYYTSGTYKRAMWVHQNTYSPTSVISITQWLFNRAEGC